MHQYMLEPTIWKADFSERALVVLMGNKLNISQQCVLVIKKAKNILGSLSNGVDSRWGGVIPPLTTGETP